MMGNQRLIGRNHALACLNRRLDQLFCRPVRPANQLNHQIHIITRRQRHRIGFKRDARHGKAAIFGGITRTHRAEDQRPASGLIQRRFALRQLACHLCSNSP